MRFFWVTRRAVPLVAGAAAAIVALSTAVAGAGADESAQRRGAVATPAAEQGTTTWTLKDLLPSLVDLGTGRVFEKGQAAFKKGACGGCHTFASESEGGGYAPDLTGVAAKFTRDLILQAILDPSAEISPNFGQTLFTLNGGATITGTIVEQNDTRVIIAPVLLALQATVEIPRANIVSDEMADVSAMPAGLLSSHTKEEIVELMAFLESGGDRNAAVYRKR